MQHRADRRCKRVPRHAFPARVPLGMDDNRGEPRDLHLILLDASRAEPEEPKKSSLAISTTCPKKYAGNPTANRPTSQRTYNGAHETSELPSVAAA